MISQVNLEFAEVFRVKNSSFAIIFFIGRNIGGLFE